MAFFASDRATDELASDGPPRTEEEARVYTWRLGRFLACNLAVEDAEALACSSVDWHEFDRLIRDGCPPIVAEKILL